MRLYLIGAGVSARTHVAAAAKLGEPVELRVADPNAETLAGFLEAFPEATGYASAEEMLAAEQAREDDVAIVATPPRFHFAPAVAAARSGRHVLCEKPLAMTVDEAEEMLRVATEHGVLFGSCSTRFRGLPHNEAVKAVMATGVLGDLVHLDFVTRSPRSRAGIEYQPSSRWFLDSRMSGGGVVMDWGPYDMSTLFDLLQPTRVEMVDAWMAKTRTGADPEGVVHDTESTAGAALRVTRQDGSVLRVNYQRANATHGEEFARAELEGTLAALRWTPFDSHQPVQLRTDAEGEPREETVEPPERDDLSIFDRPLVHFVAALRGRPSLAAIGPIAVDEFRCVRGVYDTARTGRPTVVEVRR
ncbi:Gfo/Idh/MocA family protein [Naasia sp. SYSU D00948]|uniref:Gfo/Idh/MocA family protein n=1 Tax=Naasia sp. SYSU D00948 TaxID=2817379 RepID=UPI001B308645|nr:Gfo/Idh/MocA family oxidoreductase [Naasia sp. SYSU D00948]